VNGIIRIRRQIPRSVPYLRDMLAKYEI